MFHREPWSRRSHPRRHRELDATSEQAASTHPSMPDLVEDENEDEQDPDAADGTTVVGSAPGKAKWFDRDRAINSSIKTSTVAFEAFQTNFNTNVTELESLVRDVKKQPAVEQITKLSSTSRLNSATSCNSRP